MNDRTRVWLSSKRCKNDKRMYHLRWLDPATGNWKSRSTGATDRKRAQREAIRLEDEMSAGTYHELKGIPWQPFVDEIVGFLGGRHAEEARRALNEFGQVTNPRGPRHVRVATVRAYVQHLRDKGNAVATTSKKLRYLRLAFKTAVSLDYAAANPLDGWTWAKVPKREHRILKPDEEVKLLRACNEVGGFRMQAFAEFLLGTWARHSEAVRLLWADVKFDDASVLFRDTKSHENRFVPIKSALGLLDILRRLQVQTLQDGGPFTAFTDRHNLQKKWKAIVSHAKIEHVTIHDLRRTGITRALLGGMPPVAVQRLAGHKSIATTMRYYVQLDRDDLRKAVAKLGRAV